LLSVSSLTQHLTGLFLIVALAFAAPTADAANTKKKKNNGQTHPAATRAAPLQPHPDRYAAIVVDADSGEVFFARNPDDVRFPASLTKMMTLYMTFEAVERGKLRLEQRLVTSEWATMQSPTKLNLEIGQTIAVEDAILALATKSANDASVVLAEALGGSEAQFADMMTQRARRLGMRQTTFKNASGLPDPEQTSSARDMAILGRALVRHFPNYYGYFGRTHFAFNGLTYRNHNGLLDAFPGTDGIKTGFINASGYNLVASTMRGDRRLIGVVFGGPTSAWRNQHMMQILDQTFVRLDGGSTEPAPVRVAKGAQPQKTPAASRAAQAKAPQPEFEQGDGRVAGSLAGTWAVQIGAFRQMASAERQARQATERAPSLLDGATLAISSIKDQNGTLYRVRLAGITEEAARKACNALKQKKMNCLAVPAGRG